MYESRKRDRRCFHPMEYHARHASLHSFTLNPHARATQGPAGARLMMHRAILAGVMPPVHRVTVARRLPQRCGRTRRGHAHHHSLATVTLPLCHVTHSIRAVSPCHFLPRQPATMWHITVHSMLRGHTGTSTAHHSLAPNTLCHVTQSLCATSSPSHFVPPRHHRFTVCHVSVFHRYLRRRYWRPACLRAGRRAATRTDCCGRAPGR